MPATENQSKIIGDSDAWILSSVEFQELAGKLLKQGLIAHYPFKGNAQDASGNGLHGTVYGATLTSDRFGNSNSAYQFDGIDDYIEVPHHDLLNLTDNFTISLWIKQSEANTSRGYRLVDKTTAGVNDGYNLDTYDGITGRKLRLTGGQQNTAANTVYSLNEWHHVVVVFSQGVSTFYLDGRLDGSGKQGSNSIRTNTLTLRIGVAHGSNTEFFKGIIDDVRIYNRVLSQEDIKELYEFPTALRQFVLTFDGQDDHISLPAINTDYSEGFSVEAWVKYNSFKHWSRIIDFGNGANNNNIVFANPETTKQIAIDVKTSTGEKRITSAEVLETGKWIHLAATIDKSGLAKLYKNGQLIQSGQLQLPANLNRTHNYISKSNWSHDGYFDGQLAEVRIWNISRSQEEIQEQIHSRLLGNETGLVGYWPFNEGVGNTVTDKTSHGNNGTINGATWQQQLIPLKPRTEIVTGGNAATNREFSDTNTNFYLLDTNNPVNADGVVNSWEIWAENTSPVQLIIYRKDVASWSVVGKSEVKTPIVGFNQFSLSAPIAVKKGDFVGMYHPQAGSVSFTIVGDAWNLGNLNGTVLFTASGANATAFYSSTNRTYSIKVNGEAATVNDKAATVNDKAATVNDKAATVNDKAATVNDKAATVNDKAATVNDKAATVNDKAATASLNLLTDSKIKLKSWKGDYLHRPDSDQGVTTWHTGIGNEWIVEAIADNKIKLKSWKGDYLHRPDSAQGVTTWSTGIGNEWIVESIGDNKIKLKSWKGDYLHRPDSAQGATTWSTGIGNEWLIEVIPEENPAPQPLNLPTDSKIKLKSWKEDYLHRPDSDQGVTTWSTGIGNEWIVESIGDNKIKLKSWKGDYLHRPDSAQGVTSWSTGIGNEWIVESIGDNKIKLKSWKGDYLHRPDSAQGVTSWSTGIGNEWLIEVIPEENPAPQPLNLVTPTENPAPQPLNLVTPTENPTPQPLNLVTPTENPAPQPLNLVTPTENPAPQPLNLPTDSKIKLKSWKGDYLHRPDSAQGVTTWNTGIGNEWIVESIGNNKIKLKSWKGDYLHHPDSDQGVTTWNTGIGNEWIVESIGNNKIKLKSWKGDYLHRPDSAQGVTTWSTGIGNEWLIEVIPTRKLVGVFEVLANEEVGVAVTNTNKTEIYVTFSPSGQWSHGTGPLYSAAGIPHYRQQRKLKYPNNTPFALLAINKQTKTVVAEVGTEKTIRLQPGETLLFLMNDAPGTYANNPGKITVNWSSVVLA